jgi:L-fucose mutarotase
MLKGIDPILSPELLYTLRAMGHCQELAIVDINYPCESTGPKVIRLEGVTSTRALDGILSLLPLDAEDEEPPVLRMFARGNPDKDLPIFEEFRSILDKYEVGRINLGTVDSPTFKERTKKAFAIVLSGERRLYGNVLLKKGAVRLDESHLGL